MITINKIVDSIKKYEAQIYTGVIALATIGALTWSTVRYNKGYEDGFNDCKQKTLDIVAEQTDSAFAEKIAKGEKIFTSDIGAWPGEKNVTIGNKEYHCEYNRNEDSLEIYVAEYLAAQRSYNRFTAAIDEIFELKPVLPSSTLPDPKYIK